VLSPTVELADRCMMADVGILVTAGGGRGVVVATGAATELGRIAGLVAFFESDTFAGAGDEDVDPAAISVGTAIGPDIPDLRVLPM
jgi:magnesium-transporting ATPase (P-type)